jgi:hypothetical protein
LFSASSGLIDLAVLELLVGLAILYELVLDLAVFARSGELIWGTCNSKVQSKRHFFADNCSKVLHNTVLHIVDPRFSYTARHSGIEL